MPSPVAPVKRIGFDAIAALTQGAAMRLYVATLALSLVCLAAPSSAEFTLTILHTNDFHARFQPIDATDKTCTEAENLDGTCFGGTARLITAIREAKLGAVNPVLFDGGDQFQGTLLYQLYQGQLAAEMMNALGYDAMTAGNHEFGDGPEVLREFIDSVYFPVLLANGDLSREPALAGALPRSVTISVAGEQIGLIGIAPENTSVLTGPGQRITFSAPAAAVQKEVDLLKQKGIDKIVLLSHSGYSVDLRLARETTGVDVIVGGHSHTLLGDNLLGASGPYPTMVGDTAIVQAYAYGKFLGRLVVTFDDDGRVVDAEGAPILIDAGVAENPVIKTRIAEAALPIEALRRQVVGEASEDIGGGLLGCRAGECPLGNLVAEAMLARVADQGVEIALMNGGGLRESIDAGRVTMDEVMNTLPFQNTLSTFRITGAELLKALENGVGRIERGAGRFPQVAGMRFSFDPFAPRGARIVSVEVDGQPLELERDYLVAANSFLRTGGDGYDILTGARDAYDFGPDLANVLADYLEKNRPYQPFTDGRIEMVTE